MTATRHAGGRGLSRLAGLFRTRRDRRPDLVGRTWGAARWDYPASTGQDASQHAGEVLECIDNIEEATERDTAERDDIAAAAASLAKTGATLRGVATPETVAAIVAQAQRRDTTDEATATWAKPDYLMVDRAGEQSSLPRRYTDPHVTRVDLAIVPSWTQPVTAEESASRIGRLTYPPLDATRDQYAAVMRQVSAFTGTRSPFEQPATWAARPGQRPETVIVWTPQRAARLAIEAGTGAAA
jgi:hypothetical protein